METWVLTARWLGWFGVLFLSTSWVSAVYLGDRAGTTHDERLTDTATRAGSLAMFGHAVVALVTITILPSLVDGRWRVKWLTLPLAWTVRPTRRRPG